MFPSLRFPRVIFSLVISPIFLLANTKNPIFEQSYAGRVYSSDNITYQLKNGVCKPEYAEISMQSRVPIANKYLPNFSYKEVLLSPFIHPYFSNNQQFFLELALGFTNSLRGVVSINIDTEIPQYANSIGITLGGDGENTDEIIFSIKEGNKKRLLRLENSFKEKTYKHYILPLDTHNKKRTLEKLLLKHHFNSITERQVNYALIGDISFYSFTVNKLQVVETFELMKSDVIFQKSEKPIIKPHIEKSYEYTLNESSLWGEDDTLYINTKNLALGTLEVFVSLINRVNKTAVLKIPITSLNKTVGASSCIQIKIPKDLANYQMQLTQDSYFLLKGLRYIPHYELKNEPEISSAFIQRTTWKLPQYKLDKQ